MAADSALTQTARNIVQAAYLPPVDRRRSPILT
jgi:hypothetical protein